MGLAQIASTPPTNQTGTLYKKKTVIFRAILSAMCPQNSQKWATKVVYMQKQDFEEEGSGPWSLFFTGGFPKMSVFRTHI